MIFIFLDGVGIGEASHYNPFYVAQTRYLPFFQGGLTLPDGTPIKAIDALLGVPGTPQSGSNQTSLYTGENIPLLFGEHKASYPTRPMRQILWQKNLLGLLQQQGHHAVFINAYPTHGKIFSESHVRLEQNGEFSFSAEFPDKFKHRISATSCMMLITGQKPFDETDIAAERSLFQDYTNRWLIQNGLELPEFSPEKAAHILYQAYEHYHFVLYEYFQTDLYGHRHSFHQQIALIQELDRLLGSLLECLDPHQDTLLLTSDHGNIEDNRTPAHTLNPVPLLTWGKDSQLLRDSIHCLTDVTPAILRHFNG